MKTIIDFFRNFISDLLSASVMLSYSIWSLSFAYAQRIAVLWCFVCPIIAKKLRPMLPYYVFLFWLISRSVIICFDTQIWNRIPPFPLKGSLYDGCSWWKFSLPTIGQRLSAVQHLVPGNRKSRWFMFLWAFPWLPGAKSHKSISFYHLLYLKFFPSVTRIFRVIGLVLATYSLSWETSSAALSSLVNSGRLLLNPEQRAKRIIKVFL